MPKPVPPPSSPEEYDARVAEAREDAFERVKSRCEQLALDAVSRGFYWFKLRSGSAPESVVLFFRNGEGVAVASAALSVPFLILSAASSIFDMSDPSCSISELIGYLPLALFWPV
jgi:hypothetical protein